MSDPQPDRPRRDGPPERPVLAGLVALVAVALAVGLVVGLVTLAGTRVLGLGGGSGGDAGTAQRSMYLPRPEPTPTPTAAQITLAPQGKGGSGGHRAGKGKHGKGEHGKDKDGKGKHRKSDRAQHRIRLAASTTSAAPMEQFDLAGTYPRGDGAILVVQRFQDGSWSDFPATGSVSGGTFKIPVQTSQAGLNRFRVVDSDAHRHSNQVRVRIR